MSQPYPPAVEPNAQPAILTEPMLEAIRASGPWLRFFSIMCFIGVAFMVLAGFGMIAGGIFGATFGEELGGGALFAAMGVFYLVCAGLYVLPAIYLFRAASGVVQVKRGQIVAGMEKALTNQKSFWKFIGIVTVIMLCLYPVFVVVAILIPMLASMG